MSIPSRFSTDETRALRRASEQFAELADIRVAVITIQEQAAGLNVAVSGTALGEAIAATFEAVGECERLLRQGVDRLFDHVDDPPEYGAQWRESIERTEVLFDRIREQQRGFFSEAVD